MSSVAGRKHNTPYIHLFARAYPLTRDLVYILFSCLKRVCFCDYDLEPLAPFWLSQGKGGGSKSLSPFYFRHRHIINQGMYNTLIKKS
jgi:hypothetical protein